MHDYKDFFTYLLSIIEDARWQQEHKSGISLGHLNTLIESAMDAGNIPFPERPCSKCHRYFRISTIIEPSHTCDRLNCKQGGPLD